MKAPAASLSPLLPTVGAVLVALWASIGMGTQAQGQEAAPPAAAAIPASAAAAAASAATQDAVPPGAASGSSPASSEPSPPVAAPTAASVPRAPAARRPVPRSAANGPNWSSLKPEQRAALRPLREHWSGIDTLRKQKWLEIAQRFGRMTPAEQERLQARMTQWASLSPEQRSNARLTFQEAQQIPPDVLHDRWAAYLALSEQERQKLAEQALQPPGKTLRTARRERGAGRRSPAKSNLVPNPFHAAVAQPVAPTTLRAWPGASTLPLRQPMQPPWHLQPGLPKIAATPEFVDPKTLAPRVGPQALGVALPANPPPPP